MTAAQLCRRQGTSVDTEANATPQAAMLDHTCTLLRCGRVAVPGHGIGLIAPTREITAKN